MSESNVQRLAQLELARHGIKTWRNNVGQGWIGKLLSKATSSGMKFVPEGSVVLGNARPLHAGLCKGSSDLIGYKSVIITQEMVGQRIAIFAGPEAKSETGRMSEEQAAWCSVVRGDGGIAGPFRSVLEALDLFRIKP